MPVTSIFEKYSRMAAVLSTHFLEKTAELFAYQATVVRAERNYEGSRWVIYACQFKHEALGHKDLNWFITDPRLYNEAFTGRARSIARCSYCLQDDHRPVACPQKPNRSFLSCMPTWPPAVQVPQPPLPAPSQEICHCCNDHKCKFYRCKYRHACLACWWATSSV